MLLAAFIVWENNNHSPLIDLSLFKNPVFVKANLIQICFQTCHFGAIFLIGLYLQVALGFSATLTGLIMGMQGVGAILISRYSVKLLNQYGPTVPLSIGLAGVALVSPGILLIPLFKGITFGIILFFIRGIFSGLCGTPIQVLSVFSFSKEQMSQVNTLFNICRQVAISLGIAIYAILIAMSLQYHHIASLELIQRPQIVGVFILGSLSISLLAMTGLFIANSIGRCSMTADS